MYRKSSPFEDVNNLWLIYDFRQKKIWFFHIFHTFCIVITTDFCKNFSKSYPKMQIVDKKTYFAPKKYHCLGLVSTFVVKRYFL